jgi:hypothetical protein
MFFHGNNAINFVVCNQTFTTPYAQGQNFKAPHMIMVDYAFHDLVDIEIFNLVVEYLEKKTMSKSCDYTKLPNKTLLFQLQMHLNLMCISSNISSLKVPTSNHMNYLQNVNGDITYTTCKSNKKWIEVSLSIFQV